MALPNPPRWSDHIQELLDLPSELVILLADLAGKSSDEIHRRITRLDEASRGYLTIAGVWIDTEVSEEVTAEAHVADGAYELLNCAASLTAKVAESHPLELRDRAMTENVILGRFPVELILTLAKLAGNSEHTIRNALRLISRYHANKLLEAGAIKSASSRVPNTGITLEPRCLLLIDLAASATAQVAKSYPKQVRAAIQASMKR